MAASGDVHTFWRALGASDGDAMAKCYTAEASFRDAVFDVRGSDVAKMWRMLLPPGSGVRVETGPLAVEGTRASGSWEAWYVFPATGRKVHNRIRSEFWLRDGRIERQVDTFGFWRWSRMALGWRGVLLGWTPLVRNAVRRRARRRLR